MPLSINYRCSRAVIRHAQTMVPEIEAWDGAPEGSVETIDEPFPLKDFLPTDLITRRVNAPNVSPWPTASSPPASPARSWVGTSVGPGGDHLLR